MRLRTWNALVLAACLMAGVVGQATGAGPAAARKQIESSLQVSGTIVIAPDGTVKSHTLDPGAPLGEPLQRFLDDRIRAWRFEPVQVDGKIVTAKVPMHLRLIAKPAEEGRINVSISSTYFGNSADRPATDQPRSAKLTRPRYPMDALQMGGKGTVYLVVQVGRDGRVVNVDAEQVNLRVLGSSGQLKVLRNSFTKSAVRAAREWTFNIPTTGEEANDDSWLVRVPVEFALVEPGEKPGKTRTGWDTYLPGPRNTGMTWAQETLQVAARPDALPDSGIYPIKQGAILLTPPAS